MVAAWIFGLYMFIGLISAAVNIKRFSFKFDWPGIIIELLFWPFFILMEILKRKE